jgi:hypothetical protein
MTIWSTYTTASSKWLCHLKCLCMLNTIESALLIGDASLGVKVKKKQTKIKHISNLNSTYVYNSKPCDNLVIF